MNPHSHSMAEQVTKATKEINQHQSNPIPEFQYIQFYKKTTKCIIDTHPHRLFPSVLIMVILYQSSLDSNFPFFVTCVDVINQFIIIFNCIIILYLPHNGLFGLNF